LLPPPPLRLLPGGTNQFPGGTFTRSGPTLFTAHSKLPLVGPMDWDFLSANAPGLDYLYNHPHVDRNRIGVTGLSGGGWQTIVLSVDFSESPVAAGAVEKWESRGVCRISKRGALLAGILLRLRGRTAVSPRST
jgi:hypothetical protein